MAAIQDAPSQLHRRSAAVLNGDIAGFSRLVADDVTATISDVERARSLTAEVVEEVGGSLVDFIGDNFLAVFPSAIAAVDAAIRIRSGLDRINLDVPARRHVAFRMGIAVGELVSDGQAVFGNAVNVAARVRETVEPGGIAITGDTLVRLDAPELEAEPLGRHLLKNIPEPVHIYRIPVDSRRTETEARAAGATSLRRPCISFREVVMLVDGDTVLARAAAVLTHELRAGLRAMPALTLVGDPEHSSLSPSHMLVVTADRDGDDCRIYTELVELTRWVPRWGERYEFSCERLREHLDTITADIVAAVDAEVVLGQYGRVYRTSLSRESVELIHRAWDRLLAGTHDGIGEAVAYLEELYRREPDSPDAAGLAAFALLLSVMMGASDDPSTDLTRAGALAIESRENGDVTGLADMVEAHALMWNGHAEDAHAKADRALSIRSTCDATYAVKASVLRYLGRWEEAVEMARQAIELAPFTPPWYPTVLASACFVGGRHSDVIDVVEPLVSAGTADPEAMLLLAASQQALGMPRNARATLAELRVRFPRLSTHEVVRAHPFVDASVAENWLALIEQIDT